MKSYGDGGGSEQSFREWALENGYCVEGNSDMMIRVVETGYLGTVDDVREYIKGLAHAKHIERDEFPDWKEDDASNPFSDEPADESVIHE